MNVILSGGRGFIASALVPELIRAGHSVRIWSRTPREESRFGVQAFPWNPVAELPSSESLAGVDAVVHLAGESVAHKWTDEVKKRIYDSRVTGTRHLVEAINRLPNKPRVLISSSATGYYGNRGEEELFESSPAGTGYLAKVCEDWEREADAAQGIRVVKIRTGMVLGAGGGALTRLLGAFRSKMGGKLGSGKQWMPWIHMDDIVGVYRHSLETPVEGVLNGTAPHPVRNEAFTEALGDVLAQPTRLTVPEFALKMMFGEMADMMLGSLKVLPRATEASGYAFRFPLIHDALKNAVHAGEK